MQSDLEAYKYELHTLQDLYEKEREVVRFLHGKVRQLHACLVAQGKNVQYLKTALYWSHYVYNRLFAKASQYFPLSYCY